MKVANTILQQLGGNRFVVMTGAKNLGGTEDSLSFRIGRNCKRVTHVKVQLNGKDLYDCTFYAIRGYKVVSEHTVSDVYADSLQYIFTLETGLDTHL